MSDAGTESWDYYYLSTDTSSGFVSTVANSQTGDTGVGIFDSSGAGGSGNPSILGDVSPDFMTDDDGNGSVSETYLGQATLDGKIVIFAVASISGNDVIVAYVPTGSLSLADVESISPGSVSDTAFTIPCFVAGTMILTPHGDRTVESLRAGDLVLTADGVAKPVLWAGRSTKSLRFADPVRTLPVRISAGALGENLPARDLLVSPGHAMLLDGALVQAGAMVNGTTIVRETKVPQTFTYYHVETDAHDLLLAEGAVTESFLAGVEDTNFDNWAERPADAGATTELAYPRVKSARQLSASVRALLAARAEVIAPALAAAA
jgi:hypothetical protein